MFIKPAQGRVVRYPNSEKRLPETGANVPDRDLFWLKRLKDGDVIKVKQEKIKETKKGSA
jgi:Protein of unknown function (DUF2635).